MYQYCIYHNIVAAIESFRALINRHSGCAEKTEKPIHCWHAAKRIVRLGRSAERTALTSSVYPSG